MLGDIPVHARGATGVILAKPDPGDRILAVARNVERNLRVDAATVDGETDDDATSALETSEETTTATEPEAKTEGDR